MRNPGTLALLALFLVACDDPSPAVGDPLSVPLVTRESVQAGTVTVSNSAATLRLDIVAQDGWTLEKVRVAVGTSLAQIPQTHQGQPLTEQFQLRSKTESASAVHFCVPLTIEPGTELVFAVYADVRDKAKASQQDCGMEPAWGAGTSFPKKPDAMYFTYVVQSNHPSDLAGKFRTQTQEQWGGASSAGNAPAYLTANFDAAFPDGVTIGLEPLSATFTSALAVLRLLPQAGAAGPLSQNSVNPVNLSNSLAGETLALALNVGFDDSDPTFSADADKLGELKVADPSSPCFGLSVREVLAAANLILGGLGDPTGYTPDQIHECVHRINLNFEDGVADLGYLGRP